MFSSEQERRIGEAVRNVERLLQEVSTTRKAREPVDVGYSRVQIFEAPSGGAWENVSGDKWRLEGCTPVKRDVSGTWTNRSLAQTETIWFIPELFGEDDTPTPTGSNLPKWMVCFNDFATKRWFVLPSGSASGDECGCCGLCGNTVSEWIDNFQTYQNNEDLTIYGYGDNYGGMFPQATNYSGSLMGITFSASVIGPPEPSISRLFSIDYLNYEEFSFQFDMVQLDFADAGTSKAFIQFLSSTGVVDIISVDISTSSSVFRTLGTGATTVTHSYSSGDVFKLQFDVDSFPAGQPATDATPVAIDVTTRGFINGTQVYTTTATLNGDKTKFCTSPAYGIREGSVNRGDTITDMWVFKAT